MDKATVIQRDLNAIRQCDAIALLPGYEKSVGAQVELAYAKFLDKEILDATTFNPLAVPPALKADANEGTKLDTGKPRYDLLAPEALAGVVDVLTVGATKYTDRNWERGISYGRVFGAAMRHLWAWWRGIETDIETGYSHLDHAACCIHFLSTYEKRGMTTFDDRPVRK
jgi:hypothetical protein